MHRSLISFYKPGLVCISEMAIWRKGWAPFIPTYGCLCFPENGHFIAKNRVCAKLYAHHCTRNKLLKDKQSFQTLWSYSYKISMPYQYPNHFSSLYSMYQSLRNFIDCNTAKRILERRGIQTLSKFDWSVFLNLKTISYFAIYVAWFFYLESRVCYG